MFFLLIPFAWLLGLLQTCLLHAAYHVTGLLVFVVVFHERLLALAASHLAQRAGYPVTIGFVSVRLSLAAFVGWEDAPTELIVYDVVIHNPPPTQTARYKSPEFLRIKRIELGVGLGSVYAAWASGGALAAHVTSFVVSGVRVYFEESSRGLNLWEILGYDDAAATKFIGEVDKGRAAAAKQDVPADDGDGGGDGGDSAAPSSSSGGAFFSKENRKKRQRQRAELFQNVPNPFGAMLETADEKRARKQAAKAKSTSASAQLRQRRRKKYAWGVPLELEVDAIVLHDVQLWLADFISNRLGDHKGSFGLLGTKSPKVRLPLVEVVDVNHPAGQEGVYVGQLVLKSLLPALIKEITTSPVVTTMLLAQGVAGVGGVAFNAATGAGATVAKGLGAGMKLVGADVVAASVGSSFGTVGSTVGSTFSKMLETPDEKRARKKAEKTLRLEAAAAAAAAPQSPRKRRRCRIVLRVVGASLDASLKPAAPYATARLAPYPGEAPFPVAAPPPSASPSKRPLRAGDPLSVTTEVTRADAAADDAAVCRMSWNEIHVLQAAPTGRAMVEVVLKSKRTGRDDVEVARASVDLGVSIKGCGGTGGEVEQELPLTTVVYAADGTAEKGRAVGTFRLGLTVMPLRKEGTDL